MPSAPSNHPRTPRVSQNVAPSNSAAAASVKNASHPAALVGPSASNHLSAAHFRNQPGAPALAGGVVGPEAAGLVPSSAEHFFVTLAAYADALDALPLDLTRSFSDLRELDAVLGSHLNSLTSRLNHLTALIQDPEIDQGQRLLALKEVAEEARAYKMGGEDKIRVALNTAETIISHTDFIDALVDQLDQFPELSPLLNPKKHLHLEQYYNAETGKLREQFLAASAQHAAAGPGTTAAILGPGHSHDANGLATASSSSKKRKVGTGTSALAKSSKPSDTASVAGSNASMGPTPSKKRKTVGGPSNVSSASNGHGGAKVVRTTTTAGGTKAEDDGWPRSASNTGRLISGAANASSSHKKKTDNTKMASSGGVSSSSSNRLPRAAHASGGAYAEGDEEEASAKRADNGRRGVGAGDDSSAGNGRDEGHTTSRGRTTRPVRGANASHLGGRSDDEEDDGMEQDPDDEDDEDQARGNNGGSSNKRSGARGGNSRGQTTQRTPRVAQVGSAAGVPPSQAVVAGGDADGDEDSRGASPAASSATGGAGNDDADERRYCFCNNVSYGDMIGCDDDDCEREWFHLGCVGLTKVPTGTWHCDACLERRAAAGKSKGKKGKVVSSSGKKVARR